MHDELDDARRELNIAEVWPDGPPPDMLNPVIQVVGAAHHPPEAFVPKRARVLIDQLKSGKIDVIEFCLEADKITHAAWVADVDAQPVPPVPTKVPPDTLAMFSVATVFLLLASLIVLGIIAAITQAL